MGMETVGMFIIGWFVVALVFSVALGGFLRKVNEAPGEEDLAEAAARQKGVRFLRGRKPASMRSITSASRTREQGKRTAN